MELERTVGMSKKKWFAETVTNVILYVVFVQFQMVLCAIFFTIRNLLLLLLKYRCNVLQSFSMSIICH